MTKSSESRTIRADFPDTGAVAAELLETARGRKTFARLADAVLELAVEQDISKASVAQVARRAGVGRTVFYRYSDSPADLLIRVLSRELDDLRALFTRLRKAPGADPHAAFEQASHAFFAHIARYAHIYGAGHSSTALTIRKILADHCTGSARAMFEDGLEQLPFAGPGSLEIFASFYGHGVAGAIEAWLAQPEPRSIDDLHTIVAGSMPAWLSFSRATPGNSGCSP